MVDGCLCEHLKANVEMIDLSSGVERELSVETKRRMSMKKEFLRPFRAFRASSGRSPHVEGRDEVNRHADGCYLPEAPINSFIVPIDRV